MKHPAAYISDHLLPVMTLAFIAGIGLASQIEFSKIPSDYFVLALLCLLTCLVVLQFFKKTQLIIWLLLPLMLAIGCYHGSLHLQLPVEKNHVYHIIKAKTDVVLIGTMATMAGFNGQTSQVTIKAHSLRLKEDAELVAIEGKISLRLLGHWPDDLSPGDTLAIRTELKRPDSHRTPGVFDYARYLARKDIWITGFVRSPLFLHKVTKPGSLLHNLRYLPERIRTKIGKQIDHAVSPDKRGLYRAILLGDRSHIDEDTLEIFKGSGIMHILAISGLHIAVIGSILYAGLFWLFSRSEQLLLNFTVKKWAAFLSLPVLLGYGLLAGMNTPVFRAVIMSAIVIIAICSNRQKSPGALLAFAAMLILIIDPLQLFTISFLLSFAAITGILFLLPVLKKLLDYSPDLSSAPSISQKVINWFTAGLLVSLVANLATVPITLYAFNRFSLVGPLANLIVEPLICFWSLGTGLFAIFFMFIQPEIASFFLQVGGLGLDAAILVAGFFSSWSFSTIWLATPPAWLISIYFVSLIVFVYSGWKKRWVSLAALISLVVCILLFFYPLRQNLPENGGSFHITYLDVGQGTATLLEYPSGFRVLIDGGGSSFTEQTVGERIIGPFLWKKGIREIDVIAITHPDADHYNGLEFIINHFSPKTLWVSDTMGHDDNFQRLTHLAEQRGIALFIPEPDDRLLKEEESLICLTNLADRQERTANRTKGNNGLILKACAGSICALFPGDIGRDSEQSLVDQGFDVQAEFLLSPHHGSITSNSQNFLAAVNPQYLLVSAGRSRKGYFPHKGLAQVCNSQQIDLFTTSDQGTLHIIAKEDGYRVYGHNRKGDNPLFPYVPVQLDEKTFITPL